LRKRYGIALALLLFPAEAFANCGPTPILDGGGVSTNTKTALDGSSYCFGFLGLVDATGATAFPNVAALADATANPTTFLHGSLLYGYNGTTWDRLRSVLTGNLKTDLSSVAGTATVTGGVAGSQGFGGLAASGATGAGNPLKVGGIFNTTQPTVTNTQAVDSQYTARGAAIVATGVDAFNIGNVPIGLTATSNALDINIKSGSGGLALDATTQGLAGCAGQTIANTNATPITNAAASTALKIVTKVAAKNVYICALNIANNAAVNVALVEGTLTTTNCDTATAGMAGGTTAATGWNFSANSGETYGNGQGVMFKTATVNHDVCLFFSAATQVSGVITWAQF
jgi:hypothetical protein